MENMKFCQSCSMPLSNNEDKGTEANGSLSEDYCKHCYNGGKFNREETMAEMIDSCVQFVVPSVYKTEEEARASMNAVFPQLKRWKQA